MLLKLKRCEFTKGTTIGMLYADGEFVGYTLEDYDRGLRQDMPLAEILRLKMRCETAIPYGTYNVTVNMSNRFKRMMPLLIDVPGFEGVRIHNGNTKEDTCGCILVGKGKGKDTVLQSVIAFNEFMAKVSSASGESISLTIE
jgi:hypothetical protein